MRKRNTQQTTTPEATTPDEPMGLVEALEKQAGSAPETKAEAFKRVANFRLEKTIARLRQFPALANTASYEYTEEQVEFILDALNTEVAAIAEAFENPNRRESIPQL